MPPLSVIPRTREPRSPATTAPRERDADARRILAAAHAVLKRSQFRSLKIRQVLIASNTSASNFYRLFPSKSHLLLALREEEIRLADQRLRAQLETLDSAAEQVKAWLAFNITSIYDKSRAERARMFLSQDLLDELPEQVQLQHDVTGGRLAEVIRKGMRDGEFRAGDPEADAAMVQHLMRGIIADGLMSPFPRAQESLVVEAYDFVLGALRKTTPS